MTLRLARAADLEQLPAIQLASRELFGSVERVEIMRMPLIGKGLMRDAMREDGLVVAAGPREIVGFGLCERLGRVSHLHQMSVRPAWTGHGIGSAILRRLLEISMRRGDEALTLITYADIPWNKPFYARHGFSEISVKDAPEHLSALLAGERADGIDVSRRTMMVRRSSRGNQLS